MFSFRPLVTAIFCTLVQAAPSVLTRPSITTLTSRQIDAFKTYTYFASAGYCDPSATLSWTCGANCDANAWFQPVASGGDGLVTQYWFVGYDPALNEVIVSHQGTDEAKIVPLVTTLS